eukprot:8301669-Karenia_brevis.AAC.1
MMNQSLSEENGEAQMIKSKEDHGYQSETTTFVHEYGILNFPDPTHAGSSSSEDYMKKAESIKATTNDESPKELPQEMPRVPRRIITCNGCGSQLQTTVFYCELCGH